jgi:hypothetical protein
MFVAIVGLSAATLVILCAIYLDYRVKSKRLTLIGRGIWKIEYDQTRQKNAVLAGSALIAMGISILVGTFSPGGVWSRIELSVGLALIMVGGMFVANHLFRDCRMNASQK